MTQFGKSGDIQHLRTVDDYIRWIHTLDNVPLVHMSGILNKALEEVLQDHEATERMVNAIRQMKVPHVGLTSWGAQAVLMHLVQKRSDLLELLLHEDPQTLIDAVVSASPHDTLDAKVLLWEAAQTVGGRAEFLMLGHMLEDALETAIWNADLDILEPLLLNPHLQMYWNGEHGEQYHLYHMLLRESNPFAPPITVHEVVAQLVRAGAPIDRVRQRSDGEDLPSALICAIRQLDEKAENGELEKWETRFIDALLHHGADWKAAEGLVQHQNVWDYICQHPMVQSSNRREKLNEIVQDRGRDPVKPRIF